MCSSQWLPGVDGLTIKDVAQQPEKHLYPVWNRLSSGSCFPPAVKRVEIPKGDGSFRSLGIPTVKDRIAQTVITKELEQIVEPLFSPSSYGYRPNKNAHQAIEQARTNCWPITIGQTIAGTLRGFLANPLNAYTGDMFCAHPVAQKALKLTRNHTDMIRSALWSIRKAHRLLACRCT